MNEAPNPIMFREEKQSAVGSLIYLQSVGRPVWSPRDYAQFAQEGYIQNPIVYRCVRMIAEAALSVPLLVYDKEEEPVDEHPFYDMMEMPNPFEGQADFLDRLYSFLLIAGNTYMEFVTEGSLKELYVLRPDRMKVILGNKGFPSAYEYKVGQDVHRYSVPTGNKQHPILHIKSFHPTNDIYGLSSIEPAAFSIDVHTEAAGYNKALLANQAKPSGALVMTRDKEGDASLTEEQFARLKNELETQYTGTRNAGKPMLLEGGLDWKQMGLSPQDLEFTNGKNQAAREIALSFGVPPMLLGIPGDNTYSNYKEANVAFYRQTILPFVCKIAQSMTVFFKPTFGKDFRLWYDQNEIAGLSQEREDTWKRLNDSTFLTTNEKREAVSYDEVDGGDEVLIPSSMVPLSMDLATEMDPNDPNYDPETDPNVEPVDDESAGKKKPKPSKPVK
jgi:HK97 family phage portal protein